MSKFKNAFNVINSLPEDILREFKTNYSTHSFENLKTLLEGKISGAYSRKACAERDMITWDNRIFELLQLYEEVTGKEYA